MKADILTGSYSSDLTFWSLSQQETELSLVQSTRSDVPNPTWIEVVTTPGNGSSVLYCVGEVDDYQGQYAGSVSSYRFHKDSLQLTLLNTVSALGASPCHLCVSPNGRHLYVSNYMSGSLTALFLNNDGSIGDSISYFTFESESHIHQTVFHNNIAYVMDLGMDRVHQYRWNEDSGELLSLGSVSLPAKSGPRHIAFHSFLPVAFVVGEVNSTIMLMHVTSDGLLEYQSSVSSLRENESAVNMGAAEIVVMKELVYVSNRDLEENQVEGRNSIGVFQYNSDTNSLQVLQHVDTLGVHPRHFLITKEGDELIVANQHSASIVVFRRDANTGALDENSGKIHTDPSGLLVNPAFVFEEV